MTAAITCSDLSFGWPDGDIVLSGISLSIGPGRTGLIGANGSGKSTLLRLIAGELKPVSGNVRVTGEVGYLPQAITLGTHRTVSDLLGITLVRAALHAIENGTALNWPGSGGETVLTALAALFLRRPDVILLDEPTNNLDIDARHRLYDAVASWHGVLLVVSHDRDLLARVDQIVEVSANAVLLYGGNLAAYEQIVATEQAAANREVTSATAQVRRERRDLIEAQVKQARRDRQGRRLAAARERLAEAEEAVRDDAEIRVELPGTAVPAGRTVLTVTGLDTHGWHPATRVVGAEAYAGPEAGVLGELIVRGPERIALTGPNGAGKTTLVRAIAGMADPPGISVLFRGARADKVAGTLSGGERFRAVLAALLLAEPPPQLLLLAEPTNNLDTASVRQLTQALHGYRGALVVASHDMHFLRSAGITRWLRLDRAVGLREIDPP